MNDILMVVVTAFGMALLSAFAVECVIMAFEVYRNSKE